MTESELDAIISNDRNRATEASYILGRHLIEGTSPFQILMNAEKGFNLIQAAAKKGHFPSLEYEVFYKGKFGNYRD